MSTGTGSIYQRREGYWAAAISLGGRRVARYAKSEKEARPRQTYDGARGWIVGRRAGGRTGEPEREGPPPGQFPGWRSESYTPGHILLWNGQVRSCSVSVASRARLPSHPPGWCTSNLSGGEAFWLTERASQGFPERPMPTPAILPSSRPWSLQPTASPSLQQPRAGTGPILVVDDDPGIRDVLAVLLSDEGYTVQTAANGLDALTSIHTWRPALILLDLQMPMMTGWEIVAQLRLLQVDIPVVFMTAGMSARAEAERHDVAGYLSKPFDLDDLLGVVARFVH